MRNSLKTITLAIGLLAGITHSTANTVSALKENFSQDLTTAIDKNTYTDIDIGKLLNTPATDSLAFQNKYELQLFVELLKSNSFINPVFISREEFEGKQGNFLIKTNEGKSDVAKKYAYDLYLPNNLKVGELIKIIQKIDGLNYGSNKPSNSFSVVFKKDIEAIISYLISTRTEENKKEINFSITNYRSLLQQDYPDESIDSLSTYEKKGDESVVKGLNNMRSEMSTFSQAKVDAIVSDAIYRNLYLSIFEYGSEILGDVGGLEQNIGIPSLQKNLDLVKKQNNATNTSVVEKQILKKVLTEIDKLHLHGAAEYNLDSLSAASSPSGILESKQILCVGKSILIHNILQKIGIKHYGLELLGHSAIMVEFANGEQFYVDMSDVGSTSLKMTKIKEYGVWEQMKIGQDTALVVKGNPEKLLLAQQIGNMSNIYKEVNLFTVYSVTDLEQAKYAILYMENAISLSQNLPFEYYTLAGLYFQTGDYQKALKSINTAVTLDPNYSLSRRLKAQICAKLKDNHGCGEAYDKYEETKHMITYKNFKNLEKQKKTLREAKNKLK